jgi:large subunit ribosomal protein L32
MALPKKKTSKMRTKRRHTAYVMKMRKKITNRVAIVKCQSCGEMRRSHHVCGTCGHFADKQVIDMLGSNLDGITTIKA